MADNASLARPYAKALFELAQESASFEAWAAGLKNLALIASDESFCALLNDPRVERSKIAALLTELSQGALPDGGSNLINLLVQNDRLNALVDIETQFTELVAKEQASMNAEVISARALTESQKASLESALATRLGLKVVLQEIVDSSLLGGAIVKAGDRVVDGSARGRLKKLTSALLR